MEDSFFFLWEFISFGWLVISMFFLNDFDGLFIAYDVQAKTCFQDFVKSLAIDVTGTTRSKQLTPLAWVPPQFGWTKVNTYASIRISNQLATYVGAFRMLNRKWFIDFVSNLGSSSLLMEERWGILYALQIAWFMSIKYICVDCNIRLVVNFDLQ